MYHLGIILFNVQKWILNRFVFRHWLHFWSSFQLTLIGKSWKTHPKCFSEISVFGAWHRPISGKLIQNILWLPIQFLQNIEAWARPISGKFIHIWMSFPNIGLCHAAEFFNFIFRLNALLWMNFPEISLCHTPKFKNWGLDEFCQKSAQLAAPNWKKTE